MSTLVNIIVVKTVDYDTLRKALTGWIDTYGERVKGNFEFKLYRSDNEICFIEADKRLDNELFVFLVNYLVYPFEGDYEKEITGFTVIDDSTAFPAKDIGEQIMLFIPSTDEEYDVVYWSMQNGDVYKTDMGFATTKTALYRQFVLPEIDFSKLPPPEIIS